MGRLPHRTGPSDAAALAGQLLLVCLRRHRGRLLQSLRSGCAGGRQHATGPMEVYRPR